MPSKRNNYTTQRSLRLEPCVLGLRSCNFLCREDNAQPWLSSKLHWWLVQITLQRVPMWYLQWFWLQFKRQCSHRLVFKTFFSAIYKCSGPIMTRVPIHSASKSELNTYCASTVLKLCLCNKVIKKQIHQTCLQRYSPSSLTTIYPVSNNKHIVIIFMNIFQTC